MPLFSDRGVPPSGSGAQAAPRRGAVPRLPARLSKQTGEQGVFGRVTELPCSTAKLAMLLFLVSYVLRERDFESRLSPARECACE
jgi:hypothetical protein